MPIGATRLGLAVFTAFAVLSVAPASAQAPSIVETCPAPALPNSPASSAPPTGSLQPTPQQLLACVEAQAVTGTLFAHWAAIARSAQVPSHHTKTAELVSEVMGFLISSDWVIGEARDLNVQVSERTVRRNFDRIRAQQFPHHGEFRKFLRSSGQTVADLLFRVRLNLLSTRIQRRVVAGERTAAGRQRALEHFFKAFRETWRARTYCVPAYAVADCGHVQEIL
jgi:hypothetical protein